MMYELCLYYGVINNSYMLFLRQVDDFTIAMRTEYQATAIIQQINQHLHLPKHNLELITRFNVMDVDQTKHFIRLHCTKYISKMAQSHKWLTDATPTSRHSSLPFLSDAANLTKILRCPMPQMPEEKSNLQHKMGIQYRHVIGEIMYPMIKCRPDITTNAILLSQYMDNPGEDHYVALRYQVQYLANTSTEGIHYWRPTPINTLPDAPLPQLHPNNYQLQELPATDSHKLIGFVDSDWATNTKKRTSMTGMVLMLAGGTVKYKSKFQSVIAHSSTEAEFVTACDTAKMILFFRFLLQDIGVEQTDATFLFEDNTGVLMMANLQSPNVQLMVCGLKNS
jgi:hypothetical protein